jgi:DNA-damage-inducible protein J
VLIDLWAQQGYNVCKRDDAMSTIVKARIDEDVKERAVEILKQSGLTISDAIRIMLTRVVTDGDYALIPNALTASVIREGRAGKNMHTAKDADDLFEQLGI